MKDKEKDQGDQEQIKLQKAEQQKKDDGKIQPMNEQIRQPEQKR
jgi:hypothetical protein